MQKTIGCQWCYKNIGERRLYHPLFNPLFDNSETTYNEKWAVACVANPENIVIFWFANDQDRIQFALIFG